MDWREELQDVVTVYVDQKSMIGTALREVLDELKVSPYDISTTFQLEELSPLVWSVTLGLENVGRLTCSITVDEIREFIQEEDNSGYPLPAHISVDNIHQALRQLIVYKVRKQLTI